MKPWPAARLESVTECEKAITALRAATRNDSKSEQVSGWKLSTFFATWSNVVVSQEYNNKQKQQWQSPSQEPKHRMAHRLHANGFRSISVRFLAERGAIRSSLPRNEQW